MSTKPHDANREIKEDYEIVSVVPTEPPEHMVGTGWHCYVIGQGANKIRGYQQGSLKTVSRSVEETVMLLNERRFGKRGRVHLNTKNHDNKGERK